MRQEFLEFPGTYVIHCHRLNHEDNGLMALINVIPEVSAYAAAIPGGNGRPASVQVRDADGDKVLQTVFPFPDFEGTPSVAMADVNGDGILDLIVGTGRGAPPEVLAYLDDPNHHEENVDYAQIASFAPFPGPNAGVTVATSSTVNGADLLVAGMTPGGQEIRRLTLERPAPDATIVAPKQLAVLPVIPGVAAAAPLGGR